MKNLYLVAALAAVIALTSVSRAQLEPSDAASGPVRAMASAAQPADVVSFRRDVVPIFLIHCASCHQDAGPMGALSLLPDSARAMLVDVPSFQAPMKRVAPGAPDQSYLINKMNGTHMEVGGRGFAMPLGGALVPAPDLGILRRWIEQGALDN